MMRRERPRVWSAPTPCMAMRRALIAVRHGVPDLRELAVCDGAQIPVYRRHEGTWIGNSAVRQYLDGLVVSGRRQPAAANPSNTCPPTQRTGFPPQTGQAARAFLRFFPGRLPRAALAGDNPRAFEVARIFSCPLSPRFPSLGVGSGPATSKRPATSAGRDLAPRAGR